MSKSKKSRMILGGADVPTDDSTGTPTNDVTPVDPSPSDKKTATVTKHWQSGNYREGIAAGITVDSSYVVNEGDPNIKSFDLTITDFTTSATGVSVTSNAHLVADSDWFDVPAGSDSSFTIVGRMKASPEMSGKYLRIDLTYGNHEKFAEIGFIFAFDIPQDTVYAAPTPPPSPTPKKADSKGKSTSKKKK